MSAGTKLSWAAAAEIARDLSTQLGPVVRRVKTVGSIRRRRPMVGDIELLAEPFIVATGFFSEPAPDLDAVRAVVQRWGKVVKDGDRFLQVELPGGLHVDLFLCHPPAEWGSLLAIRTGPQELSRFAVTLMQERGRVHRQGRVLTAAGLHVPTPNEADFFVAAGLPCLPPSLRDRPEALRPLQEVHRA